MKDLSESLNAIAKENPKGFTVKIPEWVQTKMKEEHIKPKDIAKRTRVDYTQLSAATSGKGPISQPVRAMLYYFFRSIAQG